MQAHTDHIQTTYVIMHGDLSVAELAVSGRCTLINESFMPYDLYLESIQESDIDLQIQNLDNFYHWCASRVLTLDRTYAKEILNSIGMQQAVTDRDRAQIALSYHCLSLTDIYWVRNGSETVTYKELNLYENHLETAFVDVSLRGKQVTIQNSHLIAEDLSTSGLFPKAWIRKKNGFYLYKDGNPETVRNEILASRICQCFHVNQVSYTEEWYDGQPVSSSRLITSPDFGITTWAAFSIYAVNHFINAGDYLLKLDKHGYYMMNILDYLTGNSDRHWENWGFLIDNRTNKPLRLHDLMDLNHTFEAYDSIDGTVCLPERNVFGRNMTQREAAREAVRQVGLNQIYPIEQSWFDDTSKQEMFFRRLKELRF